MNAHTPMGSLMMREFRTSCSHSNDSNILAYERATTRGVPTMAIRLYPIGVPTSAVMVCANSSVLSLMAAESLFSISIRSSIELEDQAGNASRAAMTAASTSDWLPTGTEPIVSSVAGFTTSMTPSPFASTHSPLMYRESRRIMYGRFIRNLSPSWNSIVRTSTALHGPRG